MTPTLKSELEQLSGWKVPDHDVLEWLLGKLPHKTRIDKHTIWGDPDKRRHLPDHDVYNAFLHTATNQNWQQADNPTDAATKLAIALFRAGVLKKGEV